MTEKQKSIDTYLHNFRKLMQVKSPSKASQDNYTHHIRRYLNEFPHNVKRATIPQIVEYISCIKSRSEMAQARSALKVFYEEILKQKNKIPYVPYPKLEQRIPRQHNHDKLLAAISLIRNTKHRLIFSMLLGSGLRVAEIVNLKWKDIVRTKSAINPLLIHVHGKGAKDRMIPLSENIYSMLVDCCAEYELKCETSSGHYVFGNAKPYSARSVANVVRRAGEMVGLILTPHDLRHACFFYLRDNGVDLEAIKELAGHANSNTTKIYAPLRTESVKMPL